MLAHVSMWVFFCGGDTPPPPTSRSSAAWTPSDWPLTFLQCCSVAAQECLNVKTTPPAVLFPSSCVSCVIEYCYRAEHSWTLDSYYTSVVGYGTGSRSVMTCSWVKLGGQASRRGRQKNAYFLLKTKEEQTFHWITTLQWQRGVRK